MPRVAHDYAGAGDAPAIADDADVTAIAANASRLAIDTLLGLEISEFPYAVYLIGLRKAWIFESPFETYPIDVGLPVAREAPQTLTPEEVKAEFLKIFQLFKADQDGTNSRAGSDQAPQT